MAATAPATTHLPFGFVVDDNGPDQKAAGGAAAFAERLGDAAPDATHAARCPTCTLLEESYACVGMIALPLSADAERFLVEQLPPDIDGLPGFLLRKTIAEYGYTGAEGATLRAQGLLQAAGPFTRHYGPFFRRFTVSSEQLLEELLCAGDIAPPHALAVLVHLGLLGVDGRVPAALEDGPTLGELMADLPSRRARTELLLSDGSESPGIGDSDGEDASFIGLRRYLRALYAAFVLDATVKVFPPATE